MTDELRERDEQREMKETRFPWLEARVPVEMQEFYQAAKARRARRRLVQRIVRIGAGALLAGGMLWVTLWHIQEPRPVQTLILLILFMLFLPQFLKAIWLFNKQHLELEEWGARLDAAAEWERIHGRPHKAEWRWW